jgi:tetratricopeptide (TPR) repeat protein
VQAEMYDEKALRVLMRVYQAIGRRGAALAAYERFVSLAADELGVDPEPATRDLAQSLRHAEPPTIAPAIIAPDADPDVLWTRARQALDQGDRVALDTCIAQLHAQYPVDDCRLLALEADAALLFEDCGRAAQLLEARDVKTAPLLARVAKLAMARRQKAAALEAASQALVLAGDAGDRRSEFDALLILAQTQCEMGQGVQSARSAERALGLAHEIGSPASVASALLVGGSVRINLGNREQALALFHEARSLAHEHGLRPVLAEAAYRIGVIQCDQGRLADALATTREALSLWRDLGLQYSEITTSQALALYYALLGDSAECLRIVERVGAISKALGDPIHIAIHQYHLADTLVYHDESLAPRSVAVAKDALAVFRAHDQPEWEASTLTTLGCALWLQGEFEEALDACRRASALHRELEEMDFLPGALALEGLILLNLEEPEQALACTRHGLQIVMQGSAVSDAVPEIYYAHAMALAACGEAEQAHDYFSRAYQHLVNEAAQHQDDAARQALFHRSPITRRLMKEVYARGIAPAPGSHVVSRLLPAAYGDAPVQVRWTVDAGPADVALKRAQGAITLRRARLARLQQEAEAQGVRPTVTQLAEALDVSPRTVKRDLAALRRG